MLLPALMMRAQENPQDTVKIKWGGSRILVISDKDNDAKNDTLKKPHEPSKKNFIHYSGFDIGLGALTTFDNKIRIAEDDDTTNLNTFLDLNYGKSWHVAFNVWEHGFRVYKNNVMLVTGLGMEWASYNFRKNITLNPDASTISYPNSTIAPDSVYYIKNKLKATYIKVPLLVQLNTNSAKPERSFHVAAGIEAAVRTGSRIKQKIESDGDIVKIKHRDDYNMAPFKLSYMLRVGYGNYFTMFANYSLTELFVVNKGPHVYPVSAGITIGFN